MAAPVQEVRKGDPRFHALLEEIGYLHDKKQADYGSDEDPFANIRASEEWGVSGWAGALMRANDKMHRLQRYVAKGELANESAMDSMMDIAVYAMIAYILYGEQSENEKPKDTSTSTMDSVKDAGTLPSPGICLACGRSGREHTASMAMECDRKAFRMQHSESCWNQKHGEYAPCWNKNCKNYVEMP